MASFTDKEANPAALFARLIDEIRPRQATDFESARRNLQALCHIFSLHPELRAAFVEKLKELSHSHRHSELYTSTGILPNTSFVAEFFSRIGHKILPEALEADLLRTALRKIFHETSDGLWVIGVGEEAWLHLFSALHFEEQPAASEMPRPIAEILRSLRVLSYWIAAFGMEPELLRLDRALETYESPFVTQNEELIAYIGAYPGAWRQPDTLISDDKHLRVLLDQCLQVIEKIRKRAARDGTSIRLTYHLQRLYQLIVRSEKLLDILENLRIDPDGQSAYPAIVDLFTRMIRDECQRDNLSKHWQRNTELLALRVTDNASAHGEHYITETRSEYFAMARSALVGGCIIAFMACFKILLAEAHMPPLTGAIVYCLNYGLGFCLIHILHGTVATKQPAMTANAIAASISESGGKLRDIETLTRLMARTIRSQMVAILGNICIAIPLAGLVDYAVFWLSGTHFVSPEKAVHLLEEQSLIHSGAVFYAAIAGVCLFIAGLISGYYDNYAAYNQVPERILQLEWPRRLFGESRMRRVSAYIGDNLGALAGNLFFGFLLGGTTIFGVLFGLPIDIRHVAFSSAFIGIAFVGLDFAPDLWLLLWSALGVAAIGFTNLSVSFALALNVALRARKVTETPWRMIAGAILRHLFRSPRDFFLPPKNGA
ncbi:site-specific recombinase [Propionivibrio sp.]|uniref:site-specific recombinase n=1 Tax=Propionivibrio sp. TaxID=2212460 RepID=UPI003BF13390